METTNYYIQNHDKRLILTKYIEVDDEDSNDDDMLSESILNQEFIQESVVEQNIIKNFKHLINEFQLIDDSNSAIIKKYENLYQDRSQFDDIEWNNNPQQQTTQFIENNMAQAIAYYRYAKGWSMKSIKSMLGINSLIVNKALLEFRRKSTRRHNLIKKINRVQRRI